MYLLKVSQYTYKNLDVLATRLTILQRENKIKQRERFFLTPIYIQYKQKVCPSKDSQFQINTWTTTCPSKRAHNQLCKECTSSCGPRRTRSNFPW